MLIRSYLLRVLGASSKEEVKALCCSMDALYDKVSSLVNLVDRLSVSVSEQGQAANNEHEYLADIRSEVERLGGVVHELASEYDELDTMVREIRYDLDDIPDEDKVVSCVFDALREVLR